jgi:hypothetical protein
MKGFETYFSTHGCFSTSLGLKMNMNKSFISCPCDTGKQPPLPKIVSVTGKMTNE